MMALTVFSNAKVKASTLFIVLVITFVIGAITSSIVFFAFYYRIEVADLILYKKLNTNLNSAIAELKVMPEEELKDSTAWDLYEAEEDSVSAKIIPWGIFEVAQVYAFSKNKKVQKTFLFGYTLDEESNAALCLSDSDRGLRVSGKTKVVGDCYLPQGVVKTANIDGKFYQGPQQLIQGSIFKSTRSNVSLNEAIVNDLEILLNVKESNTELKDTASISNSFSNETVYISYDQVKSLSVTSLKGNIVLFSSKPIRLTSSIKLEDIIVVAPSVILSENFKASVQVLCSDSIIVEDHVELTYPSALILLKHKNTASHAYITLNKNSEMRGVICAYSKFLNEENVIVNVNKDAIVHGQVYCNANVNCQGLVRGGIIANKLLLKTAVSINENCLLDATIDIKKRSPDFIGSKILPVSKQRGIIKWL